MVRAAAGELSQSTAAAISSGRPTTPIGSRAMTPARPASVPPVNQSIISVWMIAGQMALMRTLFAA
jgi:hypothetical protein